MSVVNLVTLLVNAACVVVQDVVVAAVPLDIAEVPVMVEGDTIIMICFPSVRFALWYIGFSCLVANLSKSQL